MNMSRRVQFASLAILGNGLVALGLLSSPSAHATSCPPMYRGYCVSTCADDGAFCQLQAHLAGCGQGEAITCQAETTGGCAGEYGVVCLIED
jgi:hypothetical protein